ncbi:hypothetical protein AZH11_05840 [Pseudomonas simiae]|nr:hypothetical protein AZH11_05840 [Pseudomonas simiae]
MLRVHLMQSWYGCSDPAMEEALYETTILRPFSGLHLDRVPVETTILNFRRLQQKYFFGMKAHIGVDAKQVDQ